MKLSTELKISYIATFIALLALVFSILEHSQNRKHNKKTVTPILIFQVQEVGSKYGIFLSNNGYGPAIVDSCIIYYEKDRVENENVWKIIFRRHFSDPIDFNIESNNIYGGLVLNAGETKLIWGSQTDELQGNKHILKGSIDNISARLYYHSIYNEKSVADFH